MVKNDLLYEFSSNFKYCIQHNRYLVLKDILNKIKNYVDISIFENDYIFEFNELNNNFPNLKTIFFFLSNIIKF